MKANELMLGNFASVYPSNMPIKIAAIHKKKVAYHATTKKLTWVRMDLLRPILLTPKIIQKNGFELKPDGWIWCKDDENEEQNYIFIQFRKGCDEVRTVELNFVGKVQGTFRQIQDVHELQNLLNVCRIKKEIEL